MQRSDLRQLEQTLSRSLRRVSPPPLPRSVIARAVGARRPHQPAVWWLRSAVVLAFLLLTAYAAHGPMPFGIQIPRPSAAVVGYATQGLRSGTPVQGPLPRVVGGCTLSVQVSGLLPMVGTITISIGQAPFALQYVSTNYTGPCGSLVTLSETPKNPQMFPFVEWSISGDAGRYANKAMRSPKFSFRLEGATSVTAFYSSTSAPGIGLGRVAGAGARPSPLP